MPRILVGAVLSAVVCAGCANEMGLVMHRPFVGREMVAEAFAGYGGGSIYDAFGVQPHRGNCSLATDLSPWNGATPPFSCSSSPQPRRGD